MYVINRKQIFTFLLIVILLSQLIIHSDKLLPTTAPQNDGITVPIIMYHSVSKNIKQSETYIVLPEELEKDLKFLSENGYTAVVMKDLIDFTNNRGELPEKPIVLTFDDGFYNNYAYLLPLLKKYNSKAVISIVGSYTDKAEELQEKNPEYSYLDWQTCKELVASGIVELQNHSYDMHKINGSRKGSKKNNNESSEQYIKLFSKDVKEMQNKMKENLGIIPTTYTYPYGLISDESVEQIKKMGFSASLSCCEGVNRLTRNPEELYRMKRFIRTNKSSVEKILKN